jgi:hypothetical protein
VNGQNVDVVDTFNFRSYIGKHRGWSKQKALAKAKGYQAVLSIGKCVSVTTHIRVYTLETVRKWCVNLRLDVARGVVNFIRN